MSRPSDVIGLAALGRLVFEGGDVADVFERLKSRAQAAPEDAGALLDLATLLLLSGQAETGLALQAQALAQQSVYRRPAPGPDPLRLLAIVAPGDLMANTPLDFLLEGANVELISLYVEPGRPLAPPPDHDVAFLAIGQSDANAQALAAIEPQLPRWPRPMLNADPPRIRALTREGVAASLADAPSVLAPPAARLSREQLAAIGAGGCPPHPFPLIVRPTASHAGIGLSRINEPAAIGPYLALQGDPEFYLSPFVDYASDDGLYRKQRIVLIGGRPFLCHHAVSERWMVHYLNAGMSESAEKRAEEAAAMAGFDAGFAARHAGALAALQARIGLDYFGFDCGETADGRLLLFEADTAMIVHAMDPTDLFAYKQPAMAKLFAAFEGLLRAAA